MNVLYTFVVVLICLNFCCGELSDDKKKQYVKSFIDHFNNLPGNNSFYDRGMFLKATKKGDNVYTTEVRLKEFQPDESAPANYLTCRGDIIDDDSTTVFLVKTECEASRPTPTTEYVEEAVSQLTTARGPVQLDNEIQPSNAYTSGEQFIAVRRDNKVPCVGCSSPVNVDAPGVDDLAHLSVKQLDKYEPTVRHTINSIISVERVVLITSGVRYNLLLTVDYNSCSDTEIETEDCNYQKTCSVGILRKPWKRLHDGSIYKAVVANNCTKQWLFGDDGEVLDEDVSLEASTANDGLDDIIKVIHHADVQSQPSQEKTLTGDRLAELEEQIIPYVPTRTPATEVIRPERRRLTATEASQPSVETLETTVTETTQTTLQPSQSQPIVTEAQVISTKDVIVDNKINQVSTSIPESNTVKETSKNSNPISADKKKAVDELLNFFDFAGYSPNGENKGDIRMKRDYGTDLRMMTLAEQFQNMKKKLENAKFVTSLSQIMVNHLNEINTEVKNRILKDVIGVEEEYENNFHYFYIQARVAIPCDSFTCKNKYTDVQICNGFINLQEGGSPSVVSAFCFDDKEENQGKSKLVKKDDPILLKLVHDAMRIIENESNMKTALRLRKINSAKTTRSVGIITKITAEFEYIDCDKTVPLIGRPKCAPSKLGSKVCDIEIHEKEMRKQRTLKYGCIERPSDKTFSGRVANASDPGQLRNTRAIKGGQLDKDPTSPEYRTLAEESMKTYLQTVGSTETHILVEVEKVTTQVVSGTTTRIDFKISPANDRNRVLQCHSEIWEQPWLNKKEITVNCDPAGTRTKRQVPGGESEQDPNNTEYFKLAEESMKKYLQTVGSTETHNIVKVEKVTTQVVSGTVTRLDFKISPENDATKVLQCHSQIWEQSWLNKKEITVNCDPAGTRTKRQVPGGESEQDPNNTEYFKLAEESMKKYLQTVGSTETHNIVKVEKVTTQVVSGTATRIDFKISPANDRNRVLQCHSQIWEQSWLKKKEITVTCEPVSSRKKRQLVGGQLEQDPNKTEYFNLAEESMKKYLQTVGSTETHNIVKVEKVTTQVVSGTATRIDFKISPKNDVTKVLQCHSEIWEQSWMNKKEITVNCEPVSSRKKRELVGGQSEHDPNSPEFKELAEESMKKYLQTVGNTQTHNIVIVEKVTTQVVSGIVTRLDFKISPKNDVTKVLQCHSEIWEQSWLNKKEITVNCDPAGTRTKRQVPGGQSEKNTNNPVYLKLAEESMKKYLQTVGSTETHNIVKVEKVTTQVVSGTVTRLDFKISPENDATKVLQCHSEIWEQSWLKKKEITVTCDPVSPRKKRELYGGQSEEVPNSPQFYKLAKESMKKYLQTVGSTQTHNIVKVEKVTTQVVSGTVTRLDFKISPENDATKVLQCHSQIWEQSWLNKKEITVNCDPAGTRTKRQVPGGESEQDPNNTEYFKLAEESMKKYLQTVGSTQTHNIVKVEKVTTQVVSGTVTRLDFKISPENDATKVLQCHSEIWEQSWLNKKEITVNCEPVSSRKKRQLVGGQSEQDPNSPEFKKLAEESMTKYLQTVGSTQKHEILKVEKVTVQIVSGTITRIDFKISPANDPTEVLKCHSEIWEQSWLKNKDINVKCKPGKKNRRLAREQTEKNWNDPKYFEIAQESMKKYVQTTGDIQYYKVIEIEKVATKILSGTLTQIDFKVSPTNCIVSLDGNPDKEDCKIKDSAIVLKCRSKIWEPASLKNREISINCSPEESRKKQEILSGNLHGVNIAALDDDRSKRKPNRRSGGRVEDDPDKIEFRQLATESLNKYEKLKKSKFSHKVVKVHRVVTQVVSGMLYQIDYSASPTSCPTSRLDLDKCEVDENVILDCYAEIWNRPWLKRKQIEVNCNVQESDEEGEEDSNNESRKKRSIDTGGQKRNSDDINSENVIKALKEDLRKDFDGEAESKKREQAEEDYIEDDVKYYYADRILSQINSRTNTQNLYKLVTIHDIRRSMHMRTPLVRIYVEIALTYCMKHVDEGHLASCIEIDGTNHEVCLARLWPKFDNEFILDHDSVVCESDLINFVSLTGFVRDELIKASMDILNRNPKRALVLANVGESRLVPSLDYKEPLKLNFMIQPTNCSLDDLVQPDIDCLPNERISVRRCLSEIYLAPHTRTIRFVNVSCTPEPRATRKKRSVTLNTANATEEEQHIQELVKETLEKLEMISIHRYKQRVLQINGYSNQITTGKMTKIDFDVGYTNCLKYEWVANISDCTFLEHLPRRHCVSFVWERLWVDNGRHIEVNCDDDETPLEANMGLDTADITTELANEALKRIEYKYPHPQKQKVVRVFSLEKQTVAGLHYRMKLEVGFTDCVALTQEEKCKIVSDMGLNRFCRVNVWLRPWTDHPPSYRVSCDYADGAADEIYHLIQAEQLFSYFLATYRPDYLEDQVEMKKRFDIFKENVKKTHEMNIYEMGTAKYGITRFSDLTIEEFRSKHMGLKTSLRDENQVPMAQAEIPKVDLPKEFDWRKFDVVTEVKDQGLCGSCWAFSVTGNIEGQWKRHTGKLLSLSEQELVDCDSLDKGCDGGLPDNAYRAIEQLGGLETESDYPYEGVDDKCVFNKSLSRVQIKGAVNITTNETGMAQWLVANGPISIGINANAMQFYMGGVSHPWKMLCSPKNLDHGVLIVGFGEADYPLFKKKLPYWIIKNSWGKGWGEQGYYRVFRGDGTCGVNQMASSAIV